jgi:hypothetical protein
MTSATPASPVRRRWLSSVAIPLLAVLAFACWAFASPVGASPDDDFHLVSTWCGGAADAELCEPGSAADERLVSPDLVSNSTCYVVDPDVSAGCQRFADDLDENLIPTERGNFDGLYPPVYYFVMSALAGHDLQSSALTMRIANSALYVGMVSLLFFLLPLRRRTALVGSIVVTLVPLGMFLIPSNNPSGWAILSAGTLWIALLGYFETTGWRRIALGAVAVASTVIGAGARADSAIYAGVAIAAVVVLTARWSREYLLACILPAVLAVAALVSFLGAGQASAASAGLAGSGGYGTYSLVVRNFLDLPWLLTGSFGTWKLGWLDTAMPSIVPFAALGALVIVALPGLALRSRRKTIAALFVLALVVAVPMYLLYKSEAIVGQQVQPRYILPLVIILVGIVLLQVDDRPWRLGRFQVWLIVAGLTVANSAALRTNLRRYLTGVDVGGGNLDFQAEWWWNIPVSPTGIWLIGTLAFAGAVGGLGLVLLRHIETARAGLVEPAEPRRSAALA